VWACEAVAEALQRDAVSQDKKLSEQRGTKVTDNVDAHNTAIKDDTLAVLKITQVIEQNPPKKVGSKRGSFDHISFVHKITTSKTNMETAKVKRMDELEYIVRMERKRKWTAARAKQEWEKYKNNPSIDRDYNGDEDEYKLRLAIPIGDYASVNAATTESKERLQIMIIVVRVRACICEARAEIDHAAASAKHL
jgi:hypothetical protein